MTTTALLNRISSLLVSACDPEQLILFGSYSKGRQHRDSDIDILVVGNFPVATRLQAQELRQLLYSIPVPIDLHVVSASELQAGLTQPFSFLYSIARSGIVLYKKSARIPLENFLTLGLSHDLINAFEET